MILLVLLIGSVQAHDHPTVKTPDVNAFAELKFEVNEGQLPDHVDYRVRIPGGSIYLEGQTLTFDIKDLSQLQQISDFKHGQTASMPDVLNGHVFKLHFVGSKLPDAKEEGEAFPDVVNYFIGNDPSLWASDVAQYKEVTYKDVYPGIDIRFYSSNKNFKYDFIVHDGADPSQIEMVYEGLDDLKLVFDNLLLETSVEQIIDKAPVSWLEKDGERCFVESSYRLEEIGDGTHVKFDVEARSGYDLIIDPTLIFSTYSGSTINNWGSTATYDSLGNMYAGGYILSTSNTASGYPITNGAYQSTFAGGQGTFRTDMAITKFNAAGSAIVYSTYLGGDGNEIPHSLVVNNQNQLYILGTTSSSDFPTSNTAFDDNFNGGPSIGTFGPNSNSSSIAYTTGSDIVVSKLSANGSNLLASTYIGGTDNDGINMGDTLQKAYADEFRGEIIVDQNDNCYVATSTASDDFPTTNNAFQSNFGGGLTDGVIFKFNSSLSNLLWCSYIGGNSDDAAYSLQFDPNFDVFCTGGTMSLDFPTTSTALNSNYQGGISDGWLAKVSNNGQNLIASTYLGTTAYDQSFFVQLDLSGFVYVVGQTLGNYPIAPNWVYSNPNSGQFLHKLSNNLQNSVFSTQWGSGNNNINLSLTAFLVNQCNHIFVSGWGGSLFGVGTATSAGGTTTNGLPTTNNAVQTTTDGHDFYFVVFEDSATSILFASFYGGTSGANGGEHTDGGTSRFDKKGIIYQSACASCGQASSFPTTTGAYATTKPAAASCNMAAVKYDLVTLEAEADVDGPLEICVDDSLQFENESFGGSIYEWDFGDGSGSNEFEPKHAYSSPGTYDVSLIIYDSVSCIFADTDSIQVTVAPGPSASVPSYPRICAGEPLQLNATGGGTYTWSPSSGLSNANIADPIATIEDLKIYTVTVEDSCGTDTAMVTLRVFPNFTKAIDDTSICKGLSGRLWAKGGTSYNWTPPLYLSHTNGARPAITPDSTTDYKVTIIDSFDCVKEYEMTVFVEGSIPNVKASGDTTVCAGDRVLLNASGAIEYEWFPKTYVQNPDLGSTPAFPDSSITYYVYVENSCGKVRDSVVIVVNPNRLEVSADTALCKGDTVGLLADGSIAYEWTSDLLENALYTPNPSLSPVQSGWFYVEGRNLQNCKKRDSIWVEVFPRPELEVSFDPDTVTGLHNVLLVANSNATTKWSSDGYIPCESCDSIVVYPRERTIYRITAIDSNLCISRDSVEVAAISKLFIPNSFTPDGDGVNDEFLIQGHNISEFTISIRNRWGQEIFQSNDMQRGWNGKRYNKGKDVPIGSYAYSIRYAILPGDEQVQTGVITLLR